MFSDPQSVTISGSAKSMPKISSSSNSRTTQSFYAANDQNTSLEISHETKPDKQRVRSMIKLTTRKIVPDPLVSTKQDYDTLTTFLVIDRPEVGWTDAEMDAQIAGLRGWLATAGFSAKLFGRES